jgi:hypothetical protein
MTVRPSGVTLTTKAHDVRPQNQILNDEALVTFEAGARWNDSLNDLLLVDDPFRRLVAAAAARALRRFRLARPVHATRLDRRFDIRAALLLLQPGVLTAQLDNRLLQRRHLAQKLDDQHLQFMKANQCCEPFPE